MFNHFLTHMDYSGQKHAEQIFQVIIVVFAIIGFVVGFVTQQLSYSMFVLAIGCTVAGLITLPPWPFFRRDPITWQDVIAVEQKNIAQTSNSQRSRKIK